jgi:hypothetical protein
MRFFFRHLPIINFQAIVEEKISNSPKQMPLPDGDRFARGEKA